jgi:hypothetical protein
MEETKVGVVGWKLVFQSIVVSIRLLLIPSGPTDYNPESLELDKL